MSEERGAQGGGRRLVEVVVVVIVVVVVVQQHRQVGQQQEVPLCSRTGGTGSSESAGASCVCGPHGNRLVGLQLKLAKKRPPVVRERYSPTFSQAVRCGIAVDTFLTKHTSIY